MAEKMTVEKAAEILGQGFHCSQCVMWHTAEALGMDKKQALKMTGGLGGGCFHGDVCGAVSAGAGAGAGIAYLLDGSLEAISHTVVNAIATTGGMVCDGAKSSCATKIAMAIDAAILGYHMYKAGKDLQPDDGIVGETAEHTISNVGRMAKLGMKETNEEIIKIMIGK